MTEPTKTSLEGVTREEGLGIVIYSWPSENFQVQASEIGVAFLNTNGLSCIAFTSETAVATIVVWCARHVESLRAGKGPVPQEELEKP